MKRTSVLGVYARNRRLTERNGGFPELEFMEREVTPELAMKLGIQLHLAGLSLADTISVLAGAVSPI